MEKTVVSCDACGKEIADGKERTHHRFTFPTGLTELMDLCRPCASIYDAWVAGFLAAYHSRQQG